MGILLFWGGIFYKCQVKLVCSVKVYDILANFLPACFIND